MQINFDLTDQEKWQIESGWISKVEMCVKHGVFDVEFIEEIDMNSVNRILECIKEEYEENKKNSFVYSNEVHLMKQLIYHPQIKYRVKCNAVSHSFSEWYDEMLEYIEYASRKIKSDFQVT